jgi:hypothetical protein
MIEENFIYAIINKDTFEVQGASSVYTKEGYAKNGLKHRPNKHNLAIARFKFEDIIVDGQEYLKHLEKLEEKNRIERKQRQIEIKKERAERLRKELEELESND